MPLITVPPYTDRCVICGEYIPEGRQVCPRCERQNDEETKKKAEELERKQTTEYTINLMDVTSKRRFSYSSPSYELACKQLHRYKHSRKVRVISYNFDPYR